MPIFIDPPQKGGGMNPLLGGPRSSNAFVSTDLKGEVFAGSIEVDQSGVTLPDNRCRYVMLVNWNASSGSDLTYTPVSANGLYEDTDSEFYYGFKGIYVAQLYPSQNSGLLPVRNTNLICVRTRPAITRKLFFAWFF